MPIGRYAETATPTSVDDLKAVITLTVSIDLHTHSQLRFRTLLKAAFRVCVRFHLCFNERTDRQTNMFTEELTYIRTFRQDIAIHPAIP
jgi:hypothetical protein